MTADELIRAVRDAIDRTEQVALAAPPGPWSTSGPDTIAEWTVYDEHWSVATATAYDHNHPLSNKPGARGPGYVDANATAEHIALHDPANVLRAAAPDRRVLKRHQPWPCRECPPERGHNACTACTRSGMPRDWPCADFTDLAARSGITVEEAPDGD